MTDSYIDYIEIKEYGDHFVEQIKSLIGATKLVNIDELRARVAAASGKVDAELQKAGIERSGLRGARGTTDEKTTAARRELEKFWGYLSSLDEGATDRAAMFAGGKLGPIANLKPADVKAKVDAALRGFEAKANLTFPERDAWQTRLKKASGDLGAALAEKGGASAVSITATAGLTAGREGFLAIYNGVAKPIVRGVLNELGRGDDMALFFKDLQVNERSSPKKAEGEAPAEAEAEGEAPAEAEAEARAEAPADAPPQKGEDEG